MNLCVWKCHVWSIARYPLTLSLEKCPNSFFISFPCNSGNLSRLNIIDGCKYIILLCLQQLFSTICVSETACSHNIIFHGCWNYWLEFRFRSFEIYSKCTMTADLANNSYYFKPGNLSCCSTVQRQIFKKTHYFASFPTPVKIW